MRGGRGDGRGGGRGDRGGGGARRLRGGTGQRPDGPAHPAAEPESAQCGVDAVQPFDRRPGQGPPGLRDRRAGRRDGPQRRSHQHPGAAAEYGQGTRRAGPARAVRQVCIQRDDAPDPGGGAQPHPTGRDGRGDPGREPIRGSGGGRGVAARRLGDPRPRDRPLHRDLAEWAADLRRAGQQRRPDRRGRRARPERGTSPPRPGAWPAQDGDTAAHRPPQHRLFARRRSTRQRDPPLLQR